MKTAALLTASIAMSLPLAAATAGEPAQNNAELLAELPEFEKPAVWFGSDAPELTIAEWIKGAPVSEFEAGRVYVVEFWATWCGPCVRAFPHLSELQAEHADDVTLIGVNIWERVDGDERAQLVGDFVARQGDKMDYTVALEEGDTMSTNWMRAAGRSGIPSAFIVDQQGKIAWMGHPMNMDEPLQQVIAGGYDFSAAAEETAEGLKPQQQMRYVMNEIVKGDNDKGYAMAVALAETDWAEDGRMLNAIAWQTLTADGVPRNAKASLKIAKAAAKATNHEDPGTLDTLARAYYETGAYDKAVKWQTKAIEMVPEQYKEQFRGALEKYTEAANKG